MRQRAPELARSLSGRRGRALWQDLRGFGVWLKSGLAWREARYLAACGRTVAKGPSRGLRYPLRAIPVARQLVPRLSGSYELEHYEWLERVLQSKPGTVVDIGSADGYFAVGCALRLPHSQVLAFETDSHLRRVCWLMAQRNGVNMGNFRVLGTCTPGSLAELHPQGPVVVICDVEGAELQLIDCESVPWLRDAHLLVEIHETLQPGVRAALVNRLAETHTITFQRTRPRTHGDLPEAARDLRGLPPASTLLSEDRPWPMEWLLGDPKSTRRAA